MDPDKLDSAVDAPSSPSPVVTVKVTPSQRKLFLGGYRHRQTGQEFHHAATQTVKYTTAEEKRKRAAKGPGMSVALQVRPHWNKYQQTDPDREVQAPDPTRRRWRRHSGPGGVGLRGGGEVELMPSTTGYITADEWREKHSPKVILIQRTVRRWLKTKNFFRARRALWAGRHGGDDDSIGFGSFGGSMSELEFSARQKKENGEKAVENNKETDKEAYQRMLAELESRHKEEKPKPVDEDEVSRRRRRAREVAEEARKMAQRAAVKQREVRESNDATMEHVIVKAGQPKIWICGGQRRKRIRVETDGTRRAKALAEAYLGLKRTRDTESVDERANAIKSALEAVEDFRDCAQKRELLRLLAREADLMRRDVRTRNLAGLRRRIASVFIRIVRSPELNPEIAKYEKLLPQPLLLSAPRPSFATTPGTVIRAPPPSSASTSAVAATEFCPSCERHLPRTRFPLSSGAVVGRCTNCLQLDNDARSGQDLVVFKTMFENIKKGEEEKDNTTSPVFQLQDTDIRYVVQNFWDNQSVLSGSKDLQSLVLVRWREEEEWSPWNCVLLTEEEGVIHARLENLDAAYGPLLVEKICHKHTLARNHFSKLSTMDKYFAAEAGGRKEEEEQEEEENAYAWESGEDGGDDEDVDDLTEEVSQIFLSGTKMI